MRVSDAPQRRWLTWLHCHPRSRPFAFGTRWSADAAPDQLATQAPPARDVARWQHWHDISHWLNLDANDIAHHQTGLDTNDTPAAPDGSRSSRMHRLATALTDLHPVRSVLDHQSWGPHHEVDPAPAPPEPPGPGIDL